MRDGPVKAYLELLKLKFEEVEFVAPLIGAKKALLREEDKRQKLLKLYANTPNRPESRQAIRYENRMFAKYLKSEAKRKNRASKRGKTGL